MWKTISVSGEFIEARRCHNAISIGKYMLVLGGINTNDDYLSDFLALEI